MCLPGSRILERMNKTRKLLLGGVLTCSAALLLLVFILNFNGGVVSNPGAAGKTAQDFNPVTPVNTAVSAKVSPAGMMTDTQILSVVGVSEGAVISLLPIIVIFLLLAVFVVLLRKPAAALKDEESTVVVDLEDAHDVYDADQSATGSSRVFYVYTALGVLSFAGLIVGLIMFGSRANNPNQQVKGKVVEEDPVKKQTGVDDHLGDFDNEHMEPVQDTPYPEKDKLCEQLKNCFHLFGKKVSEQNTWSIVNFGCQVDHLFDDSRPQKGIPNIIESAKCMELLGYHIKVGGMYLLIKEGNAPSLSIEKSNDYTIYKKYKYFTIEDIDDQRFKSLFTEEDIKSFIDYLKTVYQQSFKKPMPTL